MNYILLNKSIVSYSYKQQRNSIEDYLKNANSFTNILYLRLNKKSLKSLNKGDKVYIYCYITLSTSYDSFLDLMDELIKKDISIIFVKYGLLISTSIQHDYSLIELAKLFNEMYISFTNELTSETLQKKKNSGTTLGRPKGSNKVNTTLLESIEEIRNQLDNNVTIRAIAKQYNVSYNMMRYFISKYIHKNK